MEFLFLVTTLLIEGYKWSSKKFGQEATKWSVLLGVAVISFIWTFVTTNNIITPEFIKQFITYVAGAIATYEVIIKWLLKEGIVPVTKKVFKK